MSRVTLGSDGAGCHIHPLPSTLRHILRRPLTRLFHGGGCPRFHVCFRVFLVKCFVIVVGFYFSLVGYISLLYLLLFLFFVNVTFDAIMNVTDIVIVTTIIVINSILVIFLYIACMIITIYYLDYFILLVLLLPLPLLLPSLLFPLLPLPFFLTYLIYHFLCSCYYAITILRVRATLIGLVDFAKSPLHAGNTSESSWC